MASVCVGLFLKPGFLSISLIWFYTISAYSIENNVREQLKANKVLLLPIAYFMLTIISIVILKSNDVAVEVTTRKIHFVLIPLSFIIISSKLSKRQASYIPQIVALCCTACIIICLTNATMASEGENLSTRWTYFFYDRFTSILGIDPIYMSLFASVSFTAIAYTEIWSRRLQTVICILLLIGLILIGSIVGLISLALTCLFVIFSKYLLTKTVDFITLSFLIITVTALSASPLWKEVHAKSLSPDRNLFVNSPDQRIQIWKAAIHAIAEHPFFGHGVSGGQRALEMSYRERGFESGIAFSWNAHNEFLSTSLDFGLVGLLLLASMFVSSFFKAFKERNWMSLSLQLTFLIFFIAEAMFSRQKGIVCFVLFYCIINFNYVEKQHKASL